MLLTVDIGNTNVTLGVFPLEGKALVTSWRLSTHSHFTADDYGPHIHHLFRCAGLDPSLVRGVAVASVVPPLDRVWEDMSQRYFQVRPLFVGPGAIGSGAIGSGVKTGVKVLYKNPGEVGADRIVNAAAAYSRLKRSCIVVDFGTATTFDCVGRRGEYLGGAIAPGPAMAAEALARNTAKLPLLGLFRKPISPIGKTTEEGLYSGLFYGYVGLTREILKRLKGEMGGSPPVLATGGLAPLLGPAVGGIRGVFPDLTLEGLRIIWEMNRVSFGDKFVDKYVKGGVK
jgi:type III pantothenate kinase